MIVDHSPRRCSERDDDSTLRKRKVCMETGTLSATMVRESATSAIAGAFHVKLFQLDRSDNASLAGHRNPWGCSAGGWEMDVSSPSLFRRPPKTHYHVHPRHICRFTSKPMTATPLTDCDPLDDNPECRTPPGGVRKQTPETAHVKESTGHHRVARLMSLQKPNDPSTSSVSTWFNA